MNPSQPSTHSLFAFDNVRARELEASDLPALQAFFVANPEYFVAVNGMAPREDEARQEFEDRPPEGMSYARQIMFVFADETGELIGMASLLSDFLVDHVWHIGLFIVATSLHGTGKANAIYRHLEDWMKASGAQWIRLGAVAGNRRAERFWEKCGYLEMRRRTDIVTGRLVSTVRVFAKSLDGQCMEEYLRLVERDRPDQV